MDESALPYHRLPRMNRDDDIFAEALELPASERAAFLDRACAGDAAARARLAALLAGHDAARSFMEHSPAVRPAPARLEQPGDVIDRYTLVRKIGEGGCGSVYLAEQTVPVRRQVALKVIKLGMDTREVIARFEAERQALALMDHADIARVFDAGATATGRPYFVMEFVDGVPITKFCDEHNLTMAARLALFARVCLALQHAHQKGVIHRDLKPSNILVTLRDGIPAPRIIDFGIAKATSGRLGEHTLLTALDQFIGTPAYMSPEQAEHQELDLDTRSDIYSLGVLLYELLSGRPPYDPKSLAQAGLAEIRRIIREIDPPRPSARVSTLTSADRATVARLRGAAPQQLASSLQGDLDWIVMRCLEKDRARRYDSASALADDLNRYLAHEPVTARPASNLYRLRKLARRHRLAFAAVTAVALAVLIGLAVSTTQYLRATRAERAARLAEKSAREQAAATQAVNDFLTGDLLAQADATIQANTHQAANPDLTVREALDRAATSVGTRFSGQPLVEAAVRHTIGASYTALGAGESALPHLQRALELRRAALGPDHPDTLVTLGACARAYQTAGQFAPAIALFTELLPLKKRIVGPDDLSTLQVASDLADAHSKAGQLKEAESLQTINLADFRRLFGPDHPETLTAANNLAVTLLRLGRFDEAATLMEDTLPRLRRVLGPEHPTTLLATSTLGTIDFRLRRLVEAKALFTDALAAMRRTLGPDHPETLSVLNNLATVCREQGDVSQAAAYYTEALATMRRVLGSDHPTTLTAMNNLSRIYEAQGRCDESVALLQEAIAGQKRAVGPEHLNTLAAQGNLATTYAVMGRLDEAIPLQVEVLAIIRRVYGPEHPNALISLGNLAQRYTEADRLTEALPLHREAVELFRKINGPTHANTLRFADNYANALLAADQPAAAEPLLREELAAREKISPGSTDPDTAYARSSLGAALAAQGKNAEAEPLLLAGCTQLMAQADKIPALHLRQRRLRTVQERLVNFYTATGRAAEAAQWQEKFSTPAAN
jgi:serine/threonine protein kinase